MSALQCPHCKVISDGAHKGDRHLPACRDYGANHYPGGLVTVTRVTPRVTLTEPGNAPLAEPAPSTTAETPSLRRCHQCGAETEGGQYCSNACKQKAHRARRKGPL